MGHALKLKALSGIDICLSLFDSGGYIMKKKKTNKQQKQKKTTLPAKGLTINIYHNLS